MSSSSDAAVTGTDWAPSLDLTPRGLSRFDPARVRRAIDDGYEAGFQAGRAEALAAGQAARDAELEQLRSTATELFASIGSTTAELSRHEQTTAEAFARRVAEVAVAVARVLVERELSEETDAAVAACRRALTALGRRDGARLQMHPEDLALLDGADLPAHVQIEPTPGLARGDALVETDDRTVDARIDAALARALTALRGTDQDDRS